MYLQIQKFFNGKPILYGLNCMRAPFSVPLYQADVSPDINLQRLVTEGMFIASVQMSTGNTTGNAIRCLPRTRLDAATSTNSPTVTLNAPSFSFEVGDVIYAQACYAEVILTGTPTAGDIITIAINNISYSVTVPASPTLASIAAAFVSANATQLFTDSATTVTQRGSTGSLLFYGTDSHNIATNSSDGALQALIVSTEHNYLGDSIVPLGTIASIASPNSSGTRVVTLSGNAAQALPVNTPVGLKYNKILGIYPEPLDFTMVPTEFIAPVTNADGVYQNNLPYIDKQLKRMFVGLNINSRFYK
jgi:hypothetical protein